MKLRVKSNSIRLRLTRSETMQLAKKGIVEEAIEFSFEPPVRFVYTLEKRSSADKVLACFENGKITVVVPQSLADNWADDEQVSIEAEQKIGDGKTLRILIEKDFACLAPRRSGEDDADAFPHPSAGRERC